MRVALAQINPTVGDIDGNAAKVAEWIGRAREEGADLVDLPRALHPRLPGRGPLPEAPLPRGRTGARSRSSPPGSSGIVALVGFAEPVAERRRLPPRPQLARRARRRRGAGRLPQEPPAQLRASSTSSATSSPATEPATIEVAGAARRPDDLRGRLGAEGPPASAEAAAGARLIANPSGSPYHRGKGREREAMFAERARAYGAHFAFCNLVGGQDELVFDGQSLVARPRRRACSPGRPSSRRSCWSARSPPPRPGPLAEPLADLAEVYAALVLGLRDYVAQERLPARRPRPLGRHRLGPGGAARRRRARRRARHLRGHALPPFQRRTQADARDDRRQPRLPS